MNPTFCKLWNVIKHSPQLTQTRQICRKTSKTIKHTQNNNKAEK